jgi:hypothetical protein
MSEAVDKEIHAIKSVLAALEPLDGPARTSVLDYVIRRLSIAMAAPGLNTAATSPTTASPLTPAIAAPGGASTPHIEALKNEKSPRSANEMAALVAYYLSHVVPPEQRKNAINTQDIETYFKIASFPLPRQVRVTLQNARNAGYFDSVGNGEYRLNAVGYNLVAHNMPRGAEKASRGRKSRTAKKRAPTRKKR